uniref:Uncharacterized protein n=1 Tax=Marseillevirus LCMAC202 TaxID=2506606 RepID=A0A481YZ52_9VIRU|nr:MAG: hypothetical protein LCMAC202_05630 [Marseillevirus LCMAC202]
MFLELDGYVYLCDSFKPDPQFSTKMKDVFGWINCGDWEQEGNKWKIRVHYVSAMSFYINNKLQQFGLDVKNKSITIDAIVLLYLNRDSDTNKDDMDAVYSYIRDKLRSSSKDSHTDVEKLLLEDGRTDPTDADISSIKASIEHQPAGLLQLLLSV